MKAAVYRGAKNIVVEDIPYPKIEPNSVIIKVNSCGICGSDIHGYASGRGDGRTPGHEFAGDIVEIGAGVTGVKKGDRVVAMSARGCGECYWCKRGAIHRCSKLTMVGLGIPGAFAEYVLVPNFSFGYYSTILPETLSYQEGSTAEPIAVGWHAVEQVQPQKEDTVVVIGLGFIGLAIVQAVKSLGVKQIITSGHRAKRLALAKDCGADIVIDGTKEDIVPVVKERTGGKGADIVFEVAGTEPAFRQAVQMTARGGKISIVGLYGQPFPVSPSGFGHDVSLVNCGLRWDLPAAVRLMKEGKVNAKPLISHQFPLEKVKEAFDTASSAPDAIKVVVNITKQ